MLEEEEVTDTADQNQHHKLLPSTATKPFNFSVDW